MKEIRFYLCDDELKMLADLSQKVSEYVPEARIETFSSGNVLLECLRESDCDVLLLDIDMPDISGMEIAKQLMHSSNRPLLVFVTSHDELVYDSFQYHPFGFIRKGFLDSELSRVLDSCMKELKSRVKDFWFRADSQEVRIPLEDIRYIEAEGNYLKLYTTCETYRFRSTMAAIEAEVSDNGFIRIHKGFLVNQAAVRILANDKVQLDDGIALPMGKTYAEEARRQFMRYMRE